MCVHLLEIFFPNFLVKKYKLFFVALYTISSTLHATGRPFEKFKFRCLCLGNTFSIYLMCMRHYYQRDKTKCDSHILGIHERLVQIDTFEQTKNLVLAHTHINKLACT